MKYKKYLYIILFLASILYCYKVVFKVPGNDFNVYYLGWELFISGNAEYLYSDQGDLGRAAQGYLPPELSGTDYHRAGPMLYPPAFAMFFSPLALLPHDIAEIIWFYLNILALAAVFLLLSKKVLKDIPWHYFLVLFLISGRFIFRSIEYGQVNVLIMAGIFFCFYLYSTGKTKSSALILALISSWKISPLLLFIYFVWKRDYKYLYRAIGFTSLLFVMPALFYGLKLNMELLFQLFDQLKAFGLYTDSTNQSIAAMMYRFFTDIVVRVHSAGPPVKVFLFELSPLLIKYIIFTVQLALIVLTFIFIKLSPKDNGGKDSGGKKRSIITISLFDAGILSLLMALLSHLMWRATLVHLFIAHAAILLMLYKGQLNKWLKTAFALTVILNTLTSQGFTGARLSDWLEAFSCMTFGTLILFAVLFAGRIKYYYSGLSRTKDTAKNNRAV